MTDEEWAEWEAGSGVEWAWRQEVRESCDLAMQLRRRLNLALDELERARRKAEGLLADVNLACDLAERKVRLGPWPRTT